MPEVDEALHLSEALIARYNRLAGVAGKTRSGLMTEAFESSIDQIEYEHGILKDVGDWKSGKARSYTIDEVRKHCGLA